MMIYGSHINQTDMFVRMWWATAPCLLPVDYISAFQCREAHEKTEISMTWNLLVHGKLSLMSTLDCSSEEESWASSWVPRAARTLSPSHRHESFACFSGAVLILLHPIPEFWPKFLLGPISTQQLQRGRENARRWRATEVMWWIGASDARGSSIPSSAKMHINEGRGRPCVWLLLMDGVPSRPLGTQFPLLPCVTVHPSRWNFPVLFSEKSCCSACCWWCPHQSWCSVAVFDLITSKDRLN